MITAISNNKTPKLPFDIQLERKYNEINTDYFLSDWIEHQDERRDRTISMCNDLHIEIIDLGLRYALSKREFRNMVAKLIICKGNYFNP